MLHLMRNIPKIGNNRIISTNLIPTAQRTFSEIKVPSKDKKTNVVIFRGSKPRDDFVKQPHSTLSDLVQSTAIPDMCKPSCGSSGSSGSGGGSSSSKKDKCGSTKLPSDDMLLDVPVAINLKLNVRLEEYDIKPGDEC